MKYDYVIIGGGSAGCVLASRLTENPNVSVLLIEAGPDYSDFRTTPNDVKLGHNMWVSAYGIHSWGYPAYPTKDRLEPITIPRGKVIGGSSSINGQVICRGVPEDYDNWAEWGNTEWSFSKVLPYFIKLENDMDFGASDIHGGDGPIPVRRFKRDELLPSFERFYQACVNLGYPEDPDQNSPESFGIGMRALNNIDGVRMSTSFTYLGMARHRVNLTIKGNVFVIRLLFKENKAIGCEVLSGGEMFKIFGENIILCGGAIGSPQLLMVSGIGPKENLEQYGVTVIHELAGVGQNLRDHPAAFVLLKADSIPLDEFAPSIQIGLTCSPPNSETHSDLKICPILMSNEHAPPSVQIHSDSFHFGISFALQNAIGYGQLSICSPDATVHPLINYNYLEDRYDLDRMREALRLVLDIIGEEPLNSHVIERISPTDADLLNEASQNAWLLDNVYTDHHISGTCKMGPQDDDFAVVDQYCNVYGMENLKIVDASIMPDVVRSNTNVTVIMMAERVADWIKEERKEK